MLHDLIHRLRAALRPGAMERELDEELRYHLERQVEAHREAGLSEAEARRQARLAVGGMEQVKEECRDARGIRLLEATIQDLRYAVRALRNNPVFTLVAVFSLALGIGANTAVFTVANAVLLKSLPVRDPRELVILGHSTRNGLKGLWTMNSTGGKDPATGRPTGNTFSLDALTQFRARTADVADVFGFFVQGHAGVSSGEAPEVASIMVVSGNFFSGLGVPMALGRPLMEDDDQPGSTAVVLAFDYWQRSLNADASVLGRVLRVNGVPTTVVGVAAPGFRDFSAGAGGGDSPALFGSLRAIESFAPQRFRLRKATAPDLWWIQLMARRRPGITEQQVAARLTAVYRGVLEGSGVAALQKADDPRIEVAAGDKGLNNLRRRLRKPVLVLLGVVGIVLLMACVNVASLLVARSAARRREVAVRLSLGAGRGRIVRQLLTESLLLSALGAAFGSLLSIWGAGLLVPLLTRASHRADLSLAPDLRVVGFTVLVTALTGALFGLAPALQATRVDIASSLKQGLSLTARAGRFATGKALLAAQVALSVLILTGSGLLIRTLENLHRIDGGFIRERVLLFRLDPGQSGIGPAQAKQAHERVLEAVRAIPGVVSAAAMTHPLLSGGRDGQTLSAPEIEDGRPVNVAANTISPGFFDTLGIPIIAGRAFSERDDQEAPAVVILNQSAARRLFGDRPAVGRTLRRHGAGRVYPVQVAGVARDAKYSTLRGEMEPTVFVAYAQDDSPFGSARAYAVRTAGEPTALAGAIRQTVASVNRNLVLTDLMTQTRQIEEGLYQERLFAALLTFFGLFSLLLAAIGLHGVAAYTAARRTPEIGLRLALGAGQAHVFGLVFRQVLLPVGGGLLVGLAASWPASRAIESLLYGVKRLDAATLTVVLITLPTVALASAFLPAWRAARLDPMKALRTE